MVTRQAFRSQLDNLHEGLFRIGMMVEEALKLALRVVDEQDLALAGQVIEGDGAINAAVRQLHDQALLVIATQQPLAGDLRLISVVLSTLPELERMGDHAATVCKLQRRMMGEPHYLPLRAMPGNFAELIFEMGRQTTAILHAGLEALRRRDREFANQVAALDDEIDHLYAHIFRTTIELSRENPELINQSIHLLTMAHNLERIGDRVTNLAEQIVFLLSGEVVELNF